ncbi:MAG: GGDEF domain-containing protein, partial [Gammaproteobacteria bacterium]
VEAATRSAESTRQSFTRNPVSTTAGLLPLTVSIGIAGAVPHAGPLAMLQAADCALYRAKSAGRDCCREISDDGSHADRSDGD